MKKYGKYTRKNFDGIDLHLNVALDSLSYELVGAKPFWVKCPICTVEAVFPIIEKRILQTSRCRNCGSIGKVRLYDTGEYKIKCALGVISVGKRETTWTQRRGI